MSKMKNLLLDFNEFEDMIVDLLERANDTTPGTFNLLFEEDLSTKIMFKYFNEFTNDIELIWLTISAIEMNIVKFNPIRISINF